MAVFTAAKNGDIAALRKFIEEDSIPVDITNPRGNTPLFIAAIWGQVEAVAYLLSKGANVNVKNQRGFSPLLGAAEAGQAEAALFLLENGADTSLKTTTGQTAADLAHFGKFSGLVEKLVEAGIPLQIEQHSDLLRWKGSPEYSKTPNAYLLAGGHGCEDINFEKRNVMKPGYTLVVLSKCGSMVLLDKKARAISSMFESRSAAENSATLDMLLSINDTFEDFKEAIDIQGSIYTEGMKYPNLFYTPLLDLKESTSFNSGIFQFPLKKPILKRHIFRGAVDELDEIYDESIYPTVEGAKAIMNYVRGDLAEYKKILRVSIQEVMDRFGPGTYFFISCRVPTCAFETSNKVEELHKLNVGKYKNIVRNVPGYYEEIIKTHGLPNVNRPLIEKIKLVRQLSETQQRNRSTRNNASRGSGASGGKRTRRGQRRGTRRHF